MNTIRSIVVHADAQARCAVRLGIGLRLAQAFGAELTALYAVLPAAYTTPMLLAEGPVALDTLLAQFDSERRQKARAMFDAERAKPGASAAQARWVDASVAPSYAALAGQALVADLLVLGQHDPQDALGLADSDLVPWTLMACGTPGLVLPCVGEFDAARLAGDDLTVLLAWKPTREAARAAHAALPWLQRARRVCVAVEAVAAPGGPGPGAAELQAWLRLHGVSAEVKPTSVGHRDAGDMLLSLAADVQADLLVMGCFGHSRARELVLGGASRTVLRTMTLPTLMVH